MLLTSCQKEPNMLIPLSFAELHNPLFVAGTNMQLKLDPIKRTGLVLVYDRTEKELLVTYNGTLAIVPCSNVASMTPTDPNVLGTVQPKATEPKGVCEPGPVVTKMKV